MEVQLENEQASGLNETQNPQLTNDKSTTKQNNSIMPSQEFLPDSQNTEKSTIKPEDRPTMVKEAQRKSEIRRADDSHNRSEMLLSELPFTSEGREKILKRIKKVEELNYKLFDGLKKESCIDPHRKKRIQNINILNQKLTGQTKAMETQLKKFQADKEESVKLNSIPKKEEEEESPNLQNLKNRPRRGGAILEPGSSQLGQISLIKRLCPHIKFNQGDFFNNRTFKRSNFRVQDDSLDSDMSQRNSLLARDDHSSQDTRTKGNSNLDESSRDLLSPTSPHSKKKKMDKKRHQLNESHARDSRKVLFGQINQDSSIKTRDFTSGDSIKKLFSSKALIIKNRRQVKTKANVSRMSGSRLYQADQIESGNNLTANQSKGTASGDHRDRESDAKSKDKKQAYFVNTEFKSMDVNVSRRRVVVVGKRQPRNAELSEGQGQQESGKREGHPIVNRRYQLSKIRLNNGDQTVSIDQDNRGLYGGKSTHFVSVISPGQSVRSGQGQDKAAIKPFEDSMLHNLSSSSPRSKLKSCFNLSPPVKSIKMFSVPNDDLPETPKVKASLGQFESPDTGPRHDHRIDSLQAFDDFYYLPKNIMFNGIKNRTKSKPDAIGHSADSALKEFATDLASHGAELKMTSISTVILRKYADNSRPACFDSQNHTKSQNIEHEATHHEAINQRNKRCRQSLKIKRQYHKTFYD